MPLATQKLAQPLCGGSSPVTACVSTVIVVDGDVVVMQRFHAVVHVASGLTEGSMMT